MNKIDEVLKLKELLDSGLINQSDFDRKKKEMFEETNNESKIIYESDANIFAMSEYPVTDYSGKSYLISINSFGEKNWSTILKGSQYERLNNCMIKINNFLYVVTMYTDDYGARDYRTHNIPAYALLNKICFDGKIESSSEVFVDKNKISFKSITSNSKNSFFISGFVHALSFNKRNYFNSKTSVSKFNSEGKKGKNIIDYTNEGEND